MRARAFSKSPLYTDVKSMMFRQSAVFLCSYQDLQWECDIMYYPPSDSIIVQYGDEIADVLIVTVDQIRQMTDLELLMHDFREPLLVALKMLYKAGALKDGAYPLSTYEFIPNSALRLSCEPLLMLPC